MPVIEVNGVSHVYPGTQRPTPVLREVTVRLAEHRIGVIGSNGSGKSTFTRMLNALVVPTAGTVCIDGLDTRRSAKEVRRLVGYCFADPDAQILMPTVAEDVAFGLRRHRLSRAEVTERVDATLAAYGLEGYRDHPAHLLSGGEKQLLALASVLVTRPELVVLDEPTTLLDLPNTRRVRRLIEGMPEQLVVVTHHLDLLDGFDRVLVFDGGRIVHDGPPAEAVAHYRALYP